MIGEGKLLVSPQNLLIPSCIEILETNTYSEPVNKLMQNEFENWFKISKNHDEALDSDFSNLGENRTNMNTTAKIDTCNATYHEDSIFGDIESLLSLKMDVSHDDISEYDYQSENNLCEKTIRSSETDQKEKCIFNLEKDWHIELKNSPTQGDLNEYNLKDFEVCHGENYNSLVNDEFQNPQVKTQVGSSDVSESKAEDISDTSSQPDFIKNLALRTDVMNKNIFRALRRECRKHYEKYIAANKLPNPKRGNKKFLSNIKKFAQHLLVNTEVGFAAKDQIDYNDFIIYLGTLINYC